MIESLLKMCPKEASNYDGDDNNMSPNYIYDRGHFLIDCKSFCTKKLHLQFQSYVRAFKYS